MSESSGDGGKAYAGVMSVITLICVLVGCIYGATAPMSGRLNHMSDNVNAISTRLEDNSKRELEDAGKISALQNAVKELQRRMAISEQGHE